MIDDEYTTDSLLPGWREPGVQNFTSGVNAGQVSLTPDGTDEVPNKAKDGQSCAAGDYSLNLCGHVRRQGGCGGCDPGAIDYEFGGVA